MAQQATKSARIVSVIAGTCIALACGTNYAYSAWGPDFAKRMGLSATEANIVGASGNMGAYAMGIPAGLLIDNRGPRLAVILGAICLGCGYFPIHTAYEQGPGSVSTGLICFCSFLTGTGSCTAFSAAIKTCAYNWPSNRGTATAFPLSGFGLSAFFFTSIGHIFFDNRTSSFLELLSFGTVILNLASFFFLRLIPTTPEHSGYSRVHNHDGASNLSAPDAGDSAKLHRRSPSRTREELGGDGDDSPNVDDDEPMHARASIALAPELTGLRLLRTFDFWQLFIMFGLLSGVGLMTINNIGNSTGCLWRAYAPGTSREYIRQREQMHVAILSLMSFVGRLASGIGSDILIKRMHASRFWCLFASAGVFTIAQILALIVSNPTYLFLISSLTGLGYGALFGVYPALVADTFGVKGLSLNWGFMTWAPVITGNIYNVIFGRILDANTGNDTECMLGLLCYVSAYWLTLLSSIVGLGGAMWCVKYEKMKRAHLWGGFRPA